MRLKEVSLTTEEKRVEIYSSPTHKPTIPEEVNSRTRLEDLNLNWREKDLPERERTKHVHRLHPYLGKFIPQLVEIFLRKYFKAGQTVLDPFAGSGTTLVQANELGIDSVGFDISAFNVMLGRAKVAKYDLDKVRKEVLDILSKVEEQTQLKARQLVLLEDKLHFSEESIRYLHAWFAPKAISELLKYRRLIESGEYHYKELLKVILTRSARSARLTTHFDLDFPKHPQTKPYQCYKHSRVCTPTTEAFKFLHRYSLDTLKRLEEFETKRTTASAKVHHVDSRTAKIPPIDGVLTSPPYVGLIDYHEQHAYAYHLLGLEDKREHEIGAAANGTSRKAHLTYQENIAEVFCNAAKSMGAGGRMIVVAGDRANLYPEIARLAGLETEAVIQRHVNRRTGRRSSEFYESIFIWRKI